MSNTLEELRIQAGINKTIVQDFQNSNTEMITYSADTQALTTLVKLVVEKTLGHVEFLVDIEPDFSIIRKEVAHAFDFNGEEK
jgi:DNA topoisomerase VI subunit B